MSFHVTWEKHGVYVRYTGQTNDEEITRFAEGVEADHRFDHIRYVLHDFLECTGLTHSPEVMELLAATDGASSFTNPRIVIAVVHDREDVAAMVKTYLSAGFSKFMVREFPSLALARGWLQSHLP